MATIHSDEFERDAVRIATPSGLTMRQVASDLGVGLSTLNKWVKMVSDETGPADPDQNLLRENERLRRENRFLKEESRDRKQSVGLFSRRMWELQKRPRSSSRPKSRKVHISG
jgi:transposase